jgi:hypothetical protein
VSFWRWVDRLIDHVGEDRQHLFFPLTMVVLQLFEALFGGGRRTPPALEEHLGDLVACVDLGLVEETHEQAVAPGWVSNVAHVADV